MQGWRTAESKTTITLSVFMFQGTDVAQVFRSHLPQLFQKEHLTTFLSKFSIDLKYGYEHL